MIYYFAYGSNLHPLRLRERVASAKILGSAQLSGYRLMFHKHSHDGSAKCNLFKTDLSADSVYGAIYTLAADQKSLLDEFEGKGFGYIDRQIEIPHEGRTISCFTYLAQEAYIVGSLKPYHWYKQLVMQGADYLRFPESYLATIEAVDSREDPELSRRQAHDELLQRIVCYRC